MYMYQDADDRQLHMYMPTSSFINYFANLEIPALVQEDKLDTTDAASVEKFFADMEARVEIINVSLVLKACKEKRRPLNGSPLGMDIDFRNQNFTPNVQVMVWRFRSTPTGLRVALAKPGLSTMNCCSAVKLSSKA